MKRKLFYILGSIVGGTLLLTSCNEGESLKDNKDENTIDTNSNENEAKDNSKEDSYTIRIIDIDGKEISSKVVSGTNLYDTLALNFNVEASDSDWGHYITSIDNSIVDSNYYLAIYKNSLYSEVGVDSIEVKSNDIIDFKVECFNTSFDKYDLLVDKALYNYAKNKLQNKLNSYKDYSTSFPWELALVNLMKENNYDKVFNTNGLNDEYKESLEKANVNELQGTSFGKWYYGAKALNLDLNMNNFKESYKNYLENQTEYEDYKEYEYPFTLSIAKDLELQSYVSENIINTTYKATMEASGISWMYTGLASYKTFTKEELDASLTLDRLNDIYVSFKDVAVSSYILAYTANNINPRKVIIEDSKDLIAYLFDNYYDEEKFCFNVEESQNDYSSNQIYASLVAYKIQRDKEKAANIFE